MKKIGVLFGKDRSFLKAFVESIRLHTFCRNAYHQIQVDAHFISIILSERGMENGKDSFPVFYVNPYSTLAHTVSKLVATKAHRVWVVESASPSPSTPATPAAVPELAGA